MQQAKSESQMFTYQMRLTLDDEKLRILSAYAEIMGKIERTLFADLQRGKDASSLKSDYLKRFAITARQFNALRVQLEGKISSIQERSYEYIAETKQRIASLENKIEKLKCKHTIHQKKRRLVQQKAKLVNLQKDEACGKVRLCFGSRKLFRAQFALKENGYNSHAEWQKNWQEARSRQVFLLGSKDETSGNQSCSASLQEDGSLTLRLRLPNSMARFGKYVEIPNIRFSYGHDAILASLYSCIKHKLIPLVLYGKNSHQTKAIIGDAVKEVINWCIEKKKPLVLEKLSFQEKKATLREGPSAKLARALSSFAYNSIIRAMKSRGFRFGVEVNQVNPAYTSIIGLCKFAAKYGLSIHESAALTIARRFQGVSESLPRHLDKIPDGKGGLVTLSLPVRNRDKHVWTSWRQVQRKLRVALAGHFRATRRRSSGRPPPACCDSEITSDFAGETPAHESLAALLG